MSIVERPTRVVGRLQLPPVTATTGGTAHADAAAVYRLVWRYRRCVAACFAISLAAALLYTGLRTPLYKAEVTVEILAANLDADAPVGAAAPVEFQALQTASERILSRHLAGDVVDRLGLAGDSRIAAGASIMSFRGMPSIAAMADPGAAADAVETADLLRKRISVDVIRNTSILAVGYVSVDPLLAARIANQIADSYVDRQSERHRAMITRKRDLLANQIDEARQSLARSEAALVDHATENGIGLETDQPQLLVSTITQLNDRLIAAQAQLADLERLAGEIDAGRASSLPQVRESQSLSDLRVRASDLRAAYREGLATLRPGFPAMRERAAQIDELERQMRNQTEAIAAEIIAARDRTRMQIETLEAQLADSRDRHAIVARQTIDYAVLERAVAADRGRLNAMMSAANATIIDADLRVAPASIIDRAVSPKAPIAPSLPISLGVALLMGGLMSAAAISWSEMRRDGFADADEIEAELGLPVLADLTARQDDKKRSLRTALHAAGAGRALRTLTVAGVGQDTDSARIAFDLASDFAALGSRVLVVDADMRHPRLHRLAGIPNTHGLSDLLVPDAMISGSKPVHRSMHVNGLAIMPAGTVRNGSADLLASERMVRLLSHCRHRFDLVVIAAPPVDGTADADILARTADATVLAVMLNGSGRDHVKGAVRRLISVGGSTVGIVLAAPDRRSSKSVADVPEAADPPPVRAPETRPVRSVDVPDHGPGPFMPDIRGNLT